MESNIINRFVDENKYLDNFYMVDFVDDEGLKWTSTEHYFQAKKTTNILLQDKIRNLRHPGQAKYKGRSIKLRKDWEEKKDSIMYEALYYKFTQNSDLKQKLIATGKTKLIEGNYHHDNIWGDCYCDKCKDIEGENRLGKLLMKIRWHFKNKELKNETKKLI